MMNQITSKQLYSRWDVLSDTLKEAIASETNSGIVWKTGEAEHLPKEKLSIVSRLAGYVLMGFIHPEDLARELHENLGIDIRIAASIADPINKKVFQPLREELEKIYSPSLNEVEAPVAEGGEQTGSPQPVLMDSIVLPQAKEVIKPGTGSSVPKFFQTGQIPKPAAPPPAPAPKPAAQSTPAVSLSNPPTVPATASTSAPFMLHTESKSQPLAPSKSGFKIGLSEEQFGKMEQKWSAPPRPAQIETSFVLEPKPIAPNRHTTEISKLSSLNQFTAVSTKQEEAKKDSRVVHYNEMKTPIAPTPKDKSILPPQVMPKKIGVSTPSQIQSAIIKTAPLPPVPPAQKPPAASKTGVPVPPSPPKPAIAQAPPQKPAEVAKQKEMLTGKPEEKELPKPTPKNL